MVDLLYIHAYLHMDRYFKSCHVVEGNKFPRSCHAFVFYHHIPPCSLVSLVSPSAWQICAIYTPYLGTYSRLASRSPGYIHVCLKAIIACMTSN